MASVEAGIPARGEIQQPSLLQRIQGGISERIHDYSHAVSEEADFHIQSILSQVEGSPLEASIETLKPRIDNELRTLDGRAVMSNLIVTALKNSVGIMYLDQSRHLWSQNRTDAIISGIFGMGALVWGFSGMRNVGLQERRVLRARSRRLQTYYQTEAGQRAAQGLGTGDGESLTGQVDRIIRRMTLGTIPTVSGQLRQ